jgi:hypothetical protein
MSCLFVIGARDLLSYHPSIYSHPRPSITIAYTLNYICLEPAQDSFDATASPHTFVARVHS